MFDYFNGDTTACFTIRRDDGDEAPLPAAHFFHDARHFTPIEQQALALCRGRVIDIGAGTGDHSLALQRRGMNVTALDYSPLAVEIMRRRGVEKVLCGSVFDFEGGPFDTGLLLMHGIGLTENLAGLDRFLRTARRFIADGGQLIFDSKDVRATDNPLHLVYHEQNRRSGRYFGEVRMQFTYKGTTGPLLGWLHVDEHTLEEHAAQAGWTCIIVLRLEDGDYLAQLQKGDGGS
jgi:SAM-dependent methyltransferase